MLSNTNDTEANSLYTDRCLSHYPTFNSLKIKLKTSLKFQTMIRRNFHESDFKWNHWKDQAYFRNIMSNVRQSVRLQFPPLYWHVISWRLSGAAADRHTIYDRAKQPDRSSGSRHPRTKTVHQRVSQHHMTLVDKPLATPRKHQRQSRIAGHPDHTTDVGKNRKNVDLHIT